jgi:hypothetical protein
MTTRSPVSRTLLAVALLALAAAAAAQGSSYYVAPSGNDSNPGTVGQPWRTLRFAVSRLRAGDTLWLRGGSYAESDIPIAVAGTSSAPISIRNHPGEVPTIDSGFAQFRTAGNADWEIHDAAKGIYRSVARFSGADSVHGYFGLGDGGWRLIPYEDYGPLSTDNEDHEETWPYYYVGPGVFWNPADQRIYVRLARGKYQSAFGYRVPADTDPRRTPMILFGRGRVLDVRSSAAHVVIEGLRLRYSGSAIDFASGCRNITVRRCDLLGGRYHVIVRSGANDVRFDEISVLDRFPPWVARSDVKRPDSGRPAHHLQGAAIYLEGRTERIEITHSLFGGLFDAIDATDMPVDVKVRHSVFSTVRDDVMEIGSAGHRVEFAFNRVVQAAAGVSWSGSGAPPPGAVGTKYIHHNVIDTSALQLYARSDPKGYLPSKWFGPNNNGLATGRAFGTHETGSITGPDPWKIYHNTIIGGPDVDNDGVGHCYSFASDPANPHEVFNNVFVQTGDQQIARGARVHDGSQIMDGNVYHRPFVGARTPLLYVFADASRTQSFTSLAAFRSSGFLGSTRWYYAPGWEAAGVQADPRLGAGYRPDPGGPAASGAVDLGAKGWPGIVGETFRGALSPGGSTNQPPVVDAGPPRTSDDGNVQLAGWASDDGLPNPPGVLRRQWSVVSAPGNVVFADPASPTTKVYLGGVGTFVLRLTGDDGVLSTSDTVSITIIGPVFNRAPTVDAGPDGSTATRSIALQGTVRDDGLPDWRRGVTLEWTLAQGPPGALVSFGDARRAQTAAAFSDPGTYVLRLTAADGALSAIDHVTIRVTQ